MATIGFASSAPAHGTAAQLALLDARLANGISTVVAWSDGTTPTSSVSLTTRPYSAGATGYGSGAGNLGNTNAWWVERATDGSWYWSFTRGSADTTWTERRGKALPTSPTASSPGTDAAGIVHTNNAVRFTTMGTLLMAMDTTAYDWFWFMLPTLGGNVQSALFEESLMTGTYPSTPTADADPRVSGAYYNATGIAVGLASVASAGGNILAYKRQLHGTGGANNVRCSFSRIVDAGTGGCVAPAASSANQMQIDPYNSTEDPVEIEVYTPGAVGVGTGRMGKLSSLRNATVFDGQHNARFANDGTDDWVYVGGIWRKWDTSRPTI